jgi:hypothetical protein
MAVALARGFGELWLVFRLMWLRTFRPALYRGWSDGDETAIASAHPSPLDLVFEEQMTHVAKPRFLHVANGTCTTRLIQAAGISGALSIWADPLHDGPVPGELTDEELLDVRLRYHTGPADITFAAWGGGIRLSIL